MYHARQFSRFLIAVFATFFLVALPAFADAPQPLKVRPSDKVYNVLVFPSGFSYAVVTQQEKLAEPPRKSEDNKLLMLRIKSGVTDPVQLVVYFKGGKVRSYLLEPDPKAMPLMYTERSLAPLTATPRDKNSYVQLFRQATSGAIPEGFTRGNLVDLPEVALQGMRIVPRDQFLSANTVLIVFDLLDLDMPAGAISPEWFYSDEAGLLAAEVVPQGDRAKLYALYSREKLSEVMGHGQ